MRTLHKSACLLALTLSGCATPGFDGERRVKVATAANPSNDELGGIPTASDVVKHIQCEIRAVQEDPRFKAFKDGKYIVFVSLTLEVSNVGGLNPTLSFTHLLEKVGTSDQKRVIGLNGKYVQTAHRTYSQTFVLKLDAEGPNAAKLCSDPDLASDHQGLRGGLRISETIAAGMKNPASVFLPPSVTGAGLQQLVIPTFATTVDFTLVRGAGLNPSWTLVDFAGPTGGNTNFLDLNQTTKDSITLSFASPGPPKPPSEVTKDAQNKIKSNPGMLAFPGVTPSSLQTELEREISAQDQAARESAAAAAAQDSVFRLLLQRVVPVQ